MKRLLWAGRLALLLVCLLVAGRAWGATIGGTAYNDARQYSIRPTRAQAIEITMPEDGQITKITARVGGVNGGLKGVIWNCGASNHTPTTVLAVSSAGTMTTSASWVDCTFPSAVSVTSGTHYAIGVICENHADGYVTDVDTGPGFYQKADNDQDYTSPAAWDDGAMTNNSYDMLSIYATYTTGSGTATVTHVILLN